MGEDEVMDIRRRFGERPGVSWCLMGDWDMKEEGKPSMGSGRWIRWSVGEVSGEWWGEEGLSSSIMSWFVLSREVFRDLRASDGVVKAGAAAAWVVAGRGVDVENRGVARKTFGPVTMRS